MRFKLLALFLVSSAALAGKCQAQTLPDFCELLVVSSHQQVIELHKPDYALTATKVGWDLRILNPELLVRISDLENPEISFCAGNQEVLARGSSKPASAVPAGTTAVYPTRHRKIQRLAGNVISITLLSRVARK